MFTSVFPFQPLSLAFHFLDKGLVEKASISVAFPAQHRTTTFVECTGTGNYQRVFHDSRGIAMVLATSYWLYVSVVCIVLIVFI